MTGHLTSQTSALHKGISSFEPYLNEIHDRYENDTFLDWPTVILATTLQTTNISLFKLLPSQGISNEPLDKRSIASVIRNIIDTHDVIDMLINTNGADQFNLHRDIMGLYLSSRINKIQSSIYPDKEERTFNHSKEWYWSKIKRSPLFEKTMHRLKSGETIFYQSRRHRLNKACGKHGDFVSGVLADLSTYVHSIPPSVWMSTLSNMYSDNESNRNTVAVWLRVSNYYFAQSIKVIVDYTGLEYSKELTSYLDNHENVFSD